VTCQQICDYESKFIKKNVDNFKVGDTVNVHTKIIEGEKERTQIFSGIVISINGQGVSKTFTIYRNAYGCSMERVFLVNSPKVSKIEVEKAGKTRRSKLYHLRGKSGKKAKVKEQMRFKTIQASEEVLSEIPKEEESKE